MWTKDTGKAVSSELAAFFVHVNAILFRFFKIRLFKKVMGGVYTLQSSRLVFGVFK